MKKIKLTLISLGLLLTIVSSGQTAISFRLANPKVIYYTESGGVPMDGDYFEFDIQVKANDLQYLYSGEIALTYNSSSLISDAGFWITTKGTVLSSSGSPIKYSLLPNNITTGIVRLPFAGNPTSVNRDPFRITDWNQISIVDFQTLLHVKVLVDGEMTGFAGINFDAAMNGKFSYITGTSTLSPYGTNVYDPANFTDTYVGRIYANGAWTQIGGSVNGVAYTNWATSVNTSVWDGEATIPTSGVSEASNLRIHSPAKLIIPATGQLTVEGNTDINTPSGLTIESDATGTGSLITGSATGSAIAQRFMSVGKWNIVSSPLVQTVSSFLTDNAAIATKDLTRGILEYLPETNAWSIPTAAGPAGDLGAGKGFSMRLQGPTDAAVTFTGTLQAGEVGVAANAGYWNCIGNPYTSAIGITSGSATIANFLTANAANFETSYGAIYVWNQPDASNGKTGSYKTISNTPEAGFNEAQQGQAFLVNAKAGVTSFSFTSWMQTHLPALALKSTDNVWPTIKLEASVGEQKSSTIIAFNSAMTKGMDQTYDAGLLKGGTDLIVYSRLVEDNGIPFAIQALPSNEYSGLIIPLGLDFKTGGEVVFSSALLNLPSDCNVILEDNLLKKFTDLSKNVYTVAIAANTSTTERFKLHTSYQTTGLDGSNDFGGKLSAYSIRNTEILVKGTVSNQAVATLYDIQGRVVLIKNLEEGSINSIATPNIKTGIYMLYVKDNNKVQGFKIPVKE